MSPHSLQKAVIHVSTANHGLIAEALRGRGLDTDYAVGRLASSSFVSRRHRYLYVETPKAACTQMKHFIAGLEGANFGFRGAPYLRETRLQMLIHQRLHFKMPTVMDLETDEVRAILSGRSDYLIFALVRNPFSRLVSAFESKVRLREPGFSSHSKRWTALEAGSDVRATFADFVREAIDLYGRQMREHHFMPQHELLLPELLPYSRVFRLEEFAAFEEAFFAHLRNRGVLGKLAFQERNRSYYPNWRLYYDEPTARRVAAFYARDFELYGYDVDSWQLDHAPPPLLTTQSDAYWRQAVIERNEMIEFLYDRMRSRY